MSAQVAAGEEAKAALRRTLIGRVVSDKADKTITVLVERQFKHPLYGKYVKKTSKIRAHDENNACSMGDLVKIESSRPYSKTKAWALLELIEKSDNNK